MSAYGSLIWSHIAALFQYVPQSLAIAAVLELISIIRLKMHGDRVRLYKAAVMFIFWAYMVSLVFITLLSREPGSRHAISLRLFETWGNTRMAHAFFFENILLFIPFGALLPLAFRRARRIRFTVLAGFLTSLGIETTQVITQMGYGQIDDILTNVVGTAIGFDIWLLIFEKSYLDIRRRK